MSSFDERLVRAGQRSIFGSVLGWHKQGLEARGRESDTLLADDGVDELHEGVRALGSRPEK